METLKVLDYSDVFIASYFTDDTQCSHSNREHTLLYLLSGELELNERGTTTLIKEGQCIFMRRDNKLILNKLVQKDKPYRSVVLKFSRNFLRDFYKNLDPQDVPLEVKRSKISLRVLPSDRPDIKSLFESITPYFDSDIKPSNQLLELKMIEGLYILLNTDKELYASLFDFTVPWKTDILDFMEENYTDDLTMEEIASFTGRSLATFKRDFSKVSDISPQKWLIQKRLEKAHELINEKGVKVTDACFDVGFKNRSHFTTAFKKHYGYAPSTDN